MAQGFSLDDLRDGVKERSAELSRDADPRTVDSDNDTKKPFEVETEDYDRTEAPKDDMRKYWRQFETTPIIRNPITSFASRVTEPGYYIESKKLSEEEIEEIGNWLEQCAIIEGQPGKDFRLIAKKAVIQREVRGTALIEKAPHKSKQGKIAGLKLINPETVEAVTRPHQNILMAPDDLQKYEDAPEAESGGAAAWLQDVLETDETQAFGTPVSKDKNDDDDTKIGFQRDEIIPLTRDADVGEVFGTSRIEAVSDRVEGLKQKLDDNDEAIASKAYPLWLFLFGTEEEPWDSSDINQFMQSHETENFHPGMKQGVRGDVSVETISGEVAEIAEYLQFDIDWIMASMPMPKYALGSFSSQAPGKVAGQAQRQDVMRQIEEARRELEEEFTPVIREIAEQKGVSEEDAKSIKLRFGNPSQPQEGVKRSEQVIRYISDSQKRRQQQQPSPQPQQQPDQTPSGRPEPNNPSERPEPQAQPETPNSDQSEPSDEEAAASRYYDVWDEQVAAELATDEIADESKDDLSAEVSDLFLKVRDRALDRIGEIYGANPTLAPVELERIANTTLRRAVREVSLRQTSRNIISEEMKEVYDEYGTEEQRRAFSNFGNVSGHSAEFFAQNVENAVRDAAEEMLRRARVLVRKGVASENDWNDVRARIENQFNDAQFEQRADLIAHMELKTAVETTKLDVFERRDDIIGIRVSNPDASTPVTRSVHGAEALFENQGEIDEQLAEQVDDDTLQQGFNPLPKVPPYHFNDTTTIEPIYREEAQT